MELNYLEQLKSELKNSGFSIDYINLCDQYAKRLIDNNLPVIFDLKHLCLMAGCSEQYIAGLLHNANSYYHQFSIKKKNGIDSRAITAPSRELKRIQKWILINILENIEISYCSKGFKKGLSILDNAEPHKNKKYIMSIDIKDFFPSISGKRIYKTFRYFGYTTELSNILTKICTYEDALPQGAPTSPYLANIVCRRLDERLVGLANKLNAQYSRYADDLTFSGTPVICEYLDFITKIIEEEGFVINKGKTRISKPTDRQMVTGLIVNNDQVRVPKEIKKRLRQHIYYCKKYGVEFHLENRKGNSRTANYKEYLYGMALYIKMVEREKGIQFLKQLSEIDWGY